MEKYYYSKINDKLLRAIYLKNYSIEGMRSKWKLKKCILMVSG